jgi:translation initiation factor 4E
MSSANKFGALCQTKKQPNKDKKKKEMVQQVVNIAKTIVEPIITNVEPVAANVEPIITNVEPIITNVEPVATNVQSKEKELMTFATFGKKKLNTGWTLWFHNDPNNWKISGYTKLITFRTYEEYANIMNRLHNVESIKNINLYLFRENIEPIWEDKANASGGNWSMKEPIENGYDLWRSIADKVVTESLLRQDQVAAHRSNLDVNGTINGISLNNKPPLNTIVKICLSDRKVSNQMLIDQAIKQKITSKIIYQIISPDK